MTRTEPGAAQRVLLVDDDSAVLAMMSQGLEHKGFELRYLQGYTPAMLVHESRILQVTIFGTLQINLESLDFSLMLPDVMTIADEVDAQLTQSMDSYMKVMRKSAAA